MPTYDYECDACGHKQEIFQNISEPVLEKCPKCKKKKFRRLFGAGAAVIFKGSGFYTTDYRGDSYNKAASADKSSESASSSSDSSASKSETKSESKPAAPAKSESSSSKPAKKKD
ncbi:FmdB family zinc ribbon protein [Anatilimnocola floriformis]|uniref:FmdB family zinc ribbon protein n=1 Tax=Anatilimnocola floriformis TaxID=2948575 RepID=UPI0020C2D947|nr:FmdB family zinc ribbon protein [Anatilimnocola floriformis]